MAKGNAPLLAFNRGLISKYGLARVDLNRTSFSGETWSNWMPRVLGSMMLRPGLQYLLGTASNDFAKSIPFIFSATDFAQLECTDQLIRPLIDDAVIARGSVSTAFTNGTFDSNLTGWTDSDETGGDSVWVTGGYMGLTGTGYNAAIRKQTLTVSGGDQNDEHAFRIVIQRGPVMFRAGSTDGGDDYVTETALGTGTHSIAFTPTGASVYVRFFNISARQVLVDSIAIEGAGTMTLPTPWVEADLHLLRWAQSADVVYVACAGYQQRKIERRATRSWSIVKYEPGDGPFRAANITKTVFTPSAQAGEITLTASRAFFRSTHVGALFRIRCSGQHVLQVLAGADQYTDAIRVVGVGSGQRSFTVTLSGTYTGTMVLQASYDEGLTWVVTNVTLTSPGSGPVSDGLDNQIVHYRVGFSAYTSGSCTAELIYTGGGLTGIVRITAYTSATSVSASVLKYLGGVNATSDWSEGTWSDYRGYPSAVALDQGRLWWAGKDKIIGSISDDYESFDVTNEGDAGPIQRSIGMGTVDTINWLLPLGQMVIGTDMAEKAAISSAEGEALTPQNFNLKDVSTLGSARVQALQTDGTGFFVHKSGVALYQIGATQSGGKASSDASILVPDLLLEGVVHIAVQRKPDTRVHCVLDDGTVAVLVFDDLEGVAAWVTVETDGDVEDVVVFPGTTEDRVIYTVNRTINGGTVRYHESWALENECRGETLNKQADSFLLYSGASTTTITGLTHLEGADVIVWGNGADLSPDDEDGVQETYTVASGNITLPSAVTSAVIGLPYTADWKSSKLAYFADMGTALTQKKRISQISLIMVDTHAKGLKYGQDFDHLDDMPGVEDGTAVDADYVWPQYDKPSIPLNGKWDTDSRLCLRATAPRPVTLSAAIITLANHDKG